MIDPCRAPTHDMQHAGMRRILPRHVGRARRRTSRCRRIGLHEALAVLRNTIHVRRFINRLFSMQGTVVAGDILPAQVVGQNMHDVWLRRGLHC